MYKHELMRLLDDDDVRRKILSIVDAPPAEPEEISAAPPTVEDDNQIPDEPPTVDEKIFALEDEIRNLKEQLQTSTQRADKIERQLNTSREENFRLRSSLAQNQQQAKKFQEDAVTWQNACEDARQRSQTLQRELDNTQGKNSRLENSLSQSEQTARALQDKLNEWQKTFNREHQRAQDLQHDFDAAQDRISRLQGIVDTQEAEIQKRFARGWELFQNYRRVGSHARQLLRGVFPHDDFTSFICGGAQTNSLETLWDVLRECIMNGRQEDAEILWEVFEYCIELVNASKAQAGYSVLPVNVGDRFDSDVHSEGPGSRAQGKISNVCLPGYQNDYNGRIIRKSVVQVS